MNNMYPNQYGYQQAPYGYNYGTPRPMAKNTQPLTQEEIEKLRRKKNELSLNIPEEELLSCACTHREKNGANALIANDDGSYTCSICKAHFTPFNGDIEGIKDAVSKLIAMLQTSKMLYLDASDEMVRQYYQIIPMLERFPLLWQVAFDNFSKYEGYDNTPINTYGGFGNGFNALNAVLTNPYAGYMMGQPQNGYYPMYQPQAPQGQYAAGPQYAQQPQGYPMYQPQAPQGQYAQPQGYPMQGQVQQVPQGQYVDPSNPMAYGVPTQAPQAPAPGAMPQAAPVDGSQNGEIQQQKTFNV